MTQKDYNKKLIERQPRFGCFVVVFELGRQLQVQVIRQDLSDLKFNPKYDLGTNQRLTRYFEEDSNHNIMEGSEQCFKA